MCVKNFRFSVVCMGRGWGNTVLLFLLRLLSSARLKFTISVTEVSTCQMMMMITNLFDVA